MKSTSLSLLTLLVGVVLLSGCGGGDAAEKALMTARASKAARKEVLSLVRQGRTDEKYLLSAAKDAVTREYQDLKKEHPISDKIKEHLGEAVLDSIGDALKECRAWLPDQKAFDACIDKNLDSQN